MPKVEIYFQDDLWDALVKCRDDLDQYSDHPNEKGDMDSLVRIACRMFLVMQEAD